MEIEMTGEREGFGKKELVPRILDAIAEKEIPDDNESLLDFLKSNLSDEVEQLMRYLSEIGRTGINREIINAMNELNAAIEGANKQLTCPIIETLKKAHALINWPRYFSGGGMQEAAIALGTNRSDYAKLAYQNKKRGAPISALNIAQKGKKSSLDWGVNKIERMLIELDSISFSVAIHYLELSDLGGGTPNLLKHIEQRSLLSGYPSWNCGRVRFEYIFDIYFRSDVGGKNKPMFDSAMNAMLGGPLTEKAINALNIILNWFVQSYERVKVNRLGQLESGRYLSSRLFITREVCSKIINRLCSLPQGKHAIDRSLRKRLIQSCLNFYPHDKNSAVLLEIFAPNSSSRYKAIVEIYYSDSHGTCEMDVEETLFDARCLEELNHWLGNFTEYFDLKQLIASLDKVFKGDERKRVLNFAPRAIAFFKWLQRRKVSYEKKLAKVCHREYLEKVANDFFALPGWRYKQNLMYMLCGESDDTKIVGVIMQYAARPESHAPYIKALKEILRKSKKGGKYWIDDDSLMKHIKEETFGEKNTAIIVLKLLRDCFTFEKLAGLSEDALSNFCNYVVDHPSPLLFLLRMLIEKFPREKVFLKGLQANMDIFSKEERGQHISAILCGFLQPENNRLPYEDSLTSLQTLLCDYGGNHSKGHSNKYN